MLKFMSPRVKVVISLPNFWEANINEATAVALATPCNCGVGRP